MEEKRKYLEYFDGVFDSTVADKMKPENWPYVAYSKEEGVVYTIIPEEPTSAYQMVDLGLPSGRKWADRNVGASSPEDAGLYFQWGDTVGYTADQVGVDKVFNLDNYFDTTDGGNTFNKYNNDGGLTVLEPGDDAVTVYMGSSYRMPTRDEVEELTENTTQTYVDLDGNEYDKQYLYDNVGAIESGKLKGIRFTGSNGNSIFIPAAGNCGDSELSNISTSGAVWASSLGGGLGFYAWSLSFSHFVFMGVGGSSSDRCFGRPVRGVQA